MATSGTINGSCTGGSGSKYNFWAEWKRNSYSIADCSSNITIDLYVQRNDGYSASAYNLESKPGITLKAGGASKTPTTYFVDTRNSKKCKIATWTGTVDHKTDGSLTLPIAATFTHSGSSSLTGGSLSGNASITTIPQASTIDSLSCATKYFDGKLTYKYTPKSDSFYNRCNISVVVNGEYIRVKTVDLGKKDASQQTATVTFTDDELEIIYNELPKTDKGTLRFTFRTYSDSGYSDQIGDAAYKEISLYIPENSSTKPSLTMTLTPVSSLPSKFSSVYVQGRSKVDANLSGSGKFKADVESYKVTVGGTNYSSPYTSDFLDKSGEITVVGTVTDSREFSNEVTQKIYVSEYSNPKILPASGEKEIICKRCDENGNYTDSGTYLRIKARRNYSPVKTADGVKKNFCKIRYRYKTENEAWKEEMWKTILSSASSTDEIDTGPLLSGALSATTTYIAEVGVIDDIGEDAYTTITIPTDKVYTHEAGARRSFAYGKYVEDDNTFDIAEDIDFKVRTPGGPSTIISDTGWISLGLSDEVIEREEVAGRIGKGCYYRVINGNHVYVAFCCEFSMVDNTKVTISKDLIPSKYRPTNYIYQLCIADNRAVARCKVRPQGDVAVDWVQNMASDAVTSSYDVSWLDGYIDYWIN